jgi:hypothetical protein
MFNLFKKQKTKITSEKLLSLGFIKNDNDYCFYYDNYFWLSYDIDFQIICINYISFYDDSNKYVVIPNNTIKYIEDLQSLCFLLTGKKLK